MGGAQKGSAGVGQIPQTAEPAEPTGTADAQPRQKFVWPPRPVVVEPLPPSLELSRLKPDPAPGVHPLPPEPEGNPPAERAPPRSWLLEAERIWMGMTREPWAARAAAAGWCPDSPADYCPRCATTVGPHEVTRDGADPVCPACRAKRLPWDRAVRLGDYDGLLREAIHEVKFKRWRALGTELGRLLGEQFGRALSALGLDAGRAVLVPIPTTFRRRMMRGIDHTLVIARAAREVLGGRLVPALARRHRPSQLDVPPSQRQANVAGAFRLKREFDLSGKLVVVVDDVRTTGATMTAACRAIRTGPHPPGQKNGSGNQIPAAVALWTAVLAVAPDPARPRRSAGPPDFGGPE